MYAIFIDDFINVIVIWLQRWKLEKKIGFKYRSLID